jgi:hypothetical protein
MTVHGREGVHSAAKGVNLAAGVRGVKQFITVFKWGVGDFQISCSNGFVYENQDTKQANLHCTPQRGKKRNFAITKAGTLPSSKG